MWLPALLILLNSVADNKAFVLEYRITVGGLPINIFDGLLVLGALFTALPVARSKSEVSEKIHPLFPWIMGAFAVAAIAGYVGAVLNDNPLYYFIGNMRNMLSVPAAVLIGYRFVSSLKASKRLAYVWLIGSLASAVLALVFVGSTAEGLSGEHTFDRLRETTLGGDTGITAASFLLFTVAADLRMFPLPITVIVACVCATSWFLVPHRAVWLAGSITTIYAMFFLSGARSGRKIAVGIVGLSLLVVVIWGSVSLVSQTTGKDFGSWITDRLGTLLPGGESASKARAWDTRIPGITRELDLWVHSPIFGQGFGIDEIDAARTGTDRFSYRHNSWTSTMAETGLVGLSGFLMVIGGTIVIGRRMVREETDWGSVMLGACASIIAFYFFVVGFMTFSFNGQRLGIVVGLASGMTLRTRALQLANRQYHGLAELPLPEWMAAPVG